MNLGRFRVTQTTLLTGVSNPEPRWQVTLTALDGSGNINKQVSEEELATYGIKTFDFTGTEPGE